MLGHEHGYFWNSREHDRVYDADSFSDWLNCFFTTGVFLGSFYVQADRGMDITVQKGYCNIKGKAWITDQDETLTVPSANGSLPRIDSVVIERNETDRTFTLKIVEGTPARNPVAPAPVRANGIYQLVLAQINVRAGATAITQSAITDTRPNELICGYVAGALNKSYFDLITNQWQEFYNDFTDTRYSDFDTWFNLIKGQLSTDAAGNLQNQINYITGEDEVDFAGQVRISRASGGRYGVYFRRDRDIAENEAISVLVVGENFSPPHIYSVKALKDFNKGSSGSSTTTSSTDPAVFLAELSLELLSRIPSPSLTSLSSRITPLESKNRKLEEEEYRIAPGEYHPEWFGWTFPAGSGMGSTYDAHIVRKNGVVFIYIKIITQTDVSSTTSLIDFAADGFTRRFSPYNWVRVNIANNNTDDGFPLAWVNRNGKMQIWASNSKPLRLGTYYLSATYLAQDDI